MRGARRFLSRETQVLLIGFSLTILRFLRKFKNRLPTSLIESRLIPFLLKQQTIKIEITQSMDGGKNITQDALKVFENQIIQRRSKYYFTINCCRTTSNILINGPYIDSFLSYENSHRYIRTKQDANSVNK